MYRVPIIQEFVQDFEYEYTPHNVGDKIGSIGYLNGNHIKNIYCVKQIWYPQKVYWKRPCWWSTIEVGSVKISYFESLYDLYPPQDIPKALIEGRIRVKIITPIEKL